MHTRVTVLTPEVHLALCMQAQVVLDKEGIELEIMPLTRHIKAIEKSLILEENGTWNLTLLCDALRELAASPVSAKEFFSEKQPVDFTHLS